MGIQVLEYLEELIEKRRRVGQLYRQRLSQIPGIHLPPLPPGNVCYTYAHMPIDVDEQASGMSRDALHSKLKQYNIHACRYSYPLICDLACYRSVPVNDRLVEARKLASRVLALPMSVELSSDDISQICNSIASCYTRAPVAL